MFKKKCTYCRKKIEKGNEISQDVKLPGFVGTHPKHFCCSDHAKEYEKEIKESSEQPHKHRGCCG